MTIKPGDKIRFKPNPNGVRLNSALDLTAEYIGTEYCVFSWENPTGGEGGESCLLRREWDKRVEPVPDFFEAGKTYTPTTTPQVIGHPTRFEVARVDEGIDGVVAYGHHSREGIPDSGRWVIRYNFDGWREVT